MGHVQVYLEIKQFHFGEIGAPAGRPEDAIVKNNVGIEVAGENRVSARLPLGLMSAAISTNSPLRVTRRLPARAARRSNTSQGSTRSKLKSAVAAPRSGVPSARTGAGDHG
jgi:hypothetical protein